MWELGGKEAIGNERAECQTCEGSGGHWGFGWDVSQLLFTKISHQQGKSKKPAKTHRMQKGTGKSYYVLHLNNSASSAWEGEMSNHF
jgi:hypothetical protein